MNALLLAEFLGRLGRARAAFPATYAAYLAQGGADLALYTWSRSSLELPVRVSCDECRKTWHWFCTVYVPAREAAEAVGERSNFDEEYEPAEDTLWLPIEEIHRLVRETGFAGGVNLDSAQQLPSLARKRTRHHELEGVFTLARGLATSKRWTAVWAELVKMAEAPTRPAPLIGFAPDQGLQYRGREYEDSGGVKVDILSREAFRKWSERHP